MPPTGAAGALPPTYVFEDLRGVGCSTMFCAPI